MKKLIILAALFAALTIPASAQLAPKTVTLAWDAIPPAQIIPDLKVRIYSETSLVIPKALWPLLIEVPASQNTATITVQPGEHYFVATTKSSFWQLESVFSNVASTPPLPSDLFNFTIRLGL